MDFDNLQPVEAASTTVTTLGAEDVLVLQAWSNVVSGLMVAGQEADRCAKSLGSADVLNGATIVRQGSVSVSQQFVNRRQVANAYGTAVQQWESRVTGLGGQYLVQLYQAKVSSDRARLEQNRLNTAIEDRVKRQLKICAMERDIALGYNRAVSTLETYQAYASPAQAPATVGNGGIPGRPVRVASPDTPNSPANQYAKQLAEQTANLQDLQRSLYQFRQQK